LLFLFVLIVFRIVELAFLAEETQTSSKHAQLQSKQGRMKRVPVARSEELVPSIQRLLLRH
jgi:hypothetical protein